MKLTQTQLVVLEDIADKQPWDGRFWRARNAIYDLGLIDLNPSRVADPNEPWWIITNAGRAALRQARE